MPSTRTGPQAALLLTPGAGSSAAHPALLAIEEEVGPLGVSCRRMDFPYRLEGRRAPDRPAKLIAAIEAAADDLISSTGLPPDRLILGGRSMGGRMCSLAVAEGLPALGLMLVSYPLHPPGRPDRSRTAHLPALTVPCLFVSGTRDACGTPAELEAAAALAAGPVTVRWVDGGDHSLRGKDAEVAAAASGWVAGLLGG